MNTNSPQFFTVISFLLASCCFESVVSISNNISCYQCVQYTNKECGNESILPCPASSDRCVTHISKDKLHGFVLKRECGLGPCSFDDVNINHSLGWNNCDRNKEDFFCVFCCRGNACNKNSASYYKLNILVLMIPFHSVFNFWSKRTF